MKMEQTEKVKVMQPIPRGEEKQEDYKESV